MTKAVVQTIVIVTCMAGFWISISTKLDTNSAASIKLIQYKETEDQANRQLLYQVLSLTSNTLSLTKSVDDISKQNQSLAEQNKKMVEDMTKILNQHTETIQEAKVAARRSSVAAENAQIDSRRALRAVSKPTPRSWFSGIFASPTPKRKR